MTANQPIYLDYAATTPVDARVLTAMLPYFQEQFGNPSSVHRFGQQAEAALEAARETLSQGLNCRPDEVIFTGCGSESDNLAIRGTVWASRQKGNHIITTPIEHHAISHTLEQMAEAAEEAVTRQAFHREIKIRMHRWVHPPGQRPKQPNPHSPLPGEVFGRLSDTAFRAEYESLDERLAALESQPAPQAGLLESIAAEVRSLRDSIGGLVPTISSSPG